eukprot:ctg_189.g122
MPSQFREHNQRPVIGADNIPILGAVVHVLRVGEVGGYKAQPVEALPRPRRVAQLPANLSHRTAAQRLGGVDNEVGSGVCVRGGIVCRAFGAAARECAVGPALTLLVAYQGAHVGHVFLQRDADEHGEQIGWRLESVPQQRPWRVLDQQQGWHSARCLASQHREHHRPSEERPPHPRAGNHEVDLLVQHEERTRWPVGLQTSLTKNSRALPDALATWPGMSVSHSTSASRRETNIYCVTRVSQ